MPKTLEFDFAKDRQEAEVQLAAAAFAVLCLLSKVELGPKTLEFDFAKERQEAEVQLTAAAVPVVFPSQSRTWDKNA